YSGVCDTPLSAPGGQIAWNETTQFSRPSPARRAVAAEFGRAHLSISTTALSSSTEIFLQVCAWDGGLTLAVAGGLQLPGLLQMKDDAEVVPKHVEQGETHGTVCPSGLPGRFEAALAPVTIATR